MYISRWVGYSGSVGIVDTDDGVEEVVSNSKMVSAVHTHSLKVLGFGGLHKTYQPQGTKTPLQLKMKLMQYVDVTMHNGVVTGVHWNVDEIRRPATIRLSDFSSKLSDFILRGNDDMGVVHATLVFDDKLDRLPKFSVSAVLWEDAAMYEDVLFDLREVTDKTLALSIYRSIFSCVGLPGYEEIAVPSKILASIVDNGERRERMSRVAVPSGMWR